MTRMCLATSTFHRLPRRTTPAGHARRCDPTTRAGTRSSRRGLNRGLAVSALVVPALLAGCQTWGPTWSEVTGARYNMTIVNRRPAIIDEVDGQGAFPNPNLIKIEPGQHRLVVQGPAPGWVGGPPLHVMILQAEPCRRYYVNAQFDNTITQQWSPVIDYVETIAGCQMPAAAAR